MLYVRLLRRFIPPYRGKVVLNVVMNLLSTVLSLFSFAAIIPVLQILFGLNRESLSWQVLDWGAGLDAVAATLKNNLFCWLGQQIDAGGAGWVLFLLGVFLVGMTGLKCLTAWLAAYYMIPIRTGVLRDLRQQLYHKVTSLPVGYFTEQRKGDVISRMTVDVNEVEVSIMSSLDMLLKDPIMILIYLLTLFFLSWQLTLFVLILLPTAGYLIGRVGRSLKRKSTKGQEQTAELLSMIEETLSGLRVIKAFVAEDKLRERFLMKNNETRDTFNHINRKYALAHPVSEFLGTALIAVLLWYGGGLILADHATIDAAEFIYYLVIFYSIINPFKDLTKAAYAVRKGAASLERIDQILSVSPSVAPPEHPETLPTVSRQSCPFLHYRNVGFSYLPDQPVLQDIELTIEEGSTVAFVGASGSGKSTLVDLLPRFYDVTEGAILYRDVDIRRLDLHDLRSHFGIVSQDAVLFNDTVWNNITFGVESATEEEVREAARKANALSFIEEMEQGFRTVVGDRGSRLSGGQRQRISIARALLKNPDILILDEATSALDNESEHQVQQALENLRAERAHAYNQQGVKPCTTIIIAHRLSTIRDVDRIFVLHEGRIVEQGTHSELLRREGHYAHLLSLSQ